MNNLRLHLLTLAALPIYSAVGATTADLHWDGGAANIGTNGDGVSSYLAGTWSTGVANLDQGNGLAHVAWNNANLDNAIFGGTYSTGTKVITIGSDITVNQIKINTGSTGGNRYDIGASATQNDFAITFGGNYSDAFPAITGNGGTNGFLNNNFPAKVTGDLTTKGGLVIRHGSDITTPGTSGRFAFTNANSNFTGDVVMVGGNLSIGSQLGAVGNKLVLKGGSLFMSSGGGTSTFTRNIDVAAASGLSTNSTAAGQIMELTGALSGSGNLTRYSNSLSGSNSSEVRLSGDLSAFTGTLENTGNNANAIITVQPTAPSGGSWKLSGGTLKLNSTDDTHINHGPGKSDLLMNGGTLNMNGKSETINGLSGATGTVNNGLAATTSTLTLGAADATASFGGILQNGAGSLALIKIGTGTQTLGGNGTFTGTTSIDGGSLVIGGSMADSPVTVKSGAKLVISGAGKDLQALTMEGGSTISAPVDTGGTNYLGIDDALTLSGGTVTVMPTFASAPALGTYDFIVPIGGISGSATVVADFSSEPSRVSGSAAIVDNKVTVTISGVGAALTWTNQAGTGVWDLNSSANFLNGASPDVFKQYDAVTLGPSSPGGTITLAGALSPAAVTVNSSNSFIFSGSGSIAGVATLTKDGIGTLTVANTNSFTGDTIVSGGALIVTGSLGTGDVLVESGGTLAGPGSIGGDITIEGTVAPGASIGTLATGDVSLSGTYVCDLDGANVDKLAVTGDLDLTDATLTLNVISAPTASHYVIATYTGSFTGNFASVPAGYVVDTTEAGKVTLRTAPVAPPVGTITFETDQSYPTALAEVAGVNSDPNGAAFTGIQGWSLGGAAASVLATNSSGEYVHGQAIGQSGAGTYSGGIKNVIQQTGANTITFDAPYFTGTNVGFMDDLDADGLFDSTDAGMVFGVGGSPARFQYRNAAFGTENFGAGFTGTAGHWYRFSITIGDNVGGNRSITMAVRNLTTSTDFDFDAGIAGIQPWTFSVTDAQFGAAPEVSDGLFVRTTASARIDNVRVTSVNPPPAGTAYDTWMAGFPSLTGNDKLPDADPDHDGVKNLLEFVLNGNPTTSDPAIRPTSSLSAGNLVFTFQRRDDSESLTTQTVQHGIDLATWTDVVIGAIDGSGGGATYTVAENGPSPDLITVTIPTSGNAKKFARLLVEEAP